MTRVGNHRTQPRAVEIQPGSPEGRDIGLSDRQLGTPSPIPGGEDHLVNPQTVRHTIPTPVPRPEFRGDMTHGVPPEKHTAHERADSMRGPNSTQDPQPTVEHHKPPQNVPPVPVYIVEQGRDVRPMRTSSHRRMQVPAAGSQPERLIGRNSGRIEVLLLNEDATHNIRFSNGIGELNGPSFGSVLPCTTSSYLKLKTQDELYGVSDDSATPYISIIEVFDRAQSEVQ